MPVFGKPRLVLLGELAFQAEPLRRRRQVRGYARRAAWTAPAPPAPVQQGGVGPARLPEPTGVVARYTLTPRGEGGGFLLRGGTQVHGSAG